MINDNPGEILVLIINDNPGEMLYKKKEDASNPFWITRMKMKPGARMLYKNTR